MKRNVVIIGITSLVATAGIISYMVAAQPQEEPVKAKAETLVVPQAQESITESSPTQEVVTEAPAPVERVQEETRPTGAKPSVSREEVSSIVSSTVASNWNAKESGLMISSANITALIMKTYDASPFENAQEVSLACIERIKAMNKEEAVRFVYGDSCL